ncbi:MAG: calcium/sodium antiporter [Clostridiales bacterium]|nr:calcium/sodium antiporter [Clostridiales bacterium]
MDFALLILGFLLLVKGADWFVDGASDIARKLHISPMIIGLTVVAFGTSAPEAAVSISASIKDSNAIALGNVIGSNIFNLLVVAGISSVIRPQKTDHQLIVKDYPFSVLGSILLMILSLGSGAVLNKSLYLSQIDGLCFLIIFVCYMTVLLFSAIRMQPRFSTASKERSVSASRAILFTLVGIICIVSGGNFTVEGATGIAHLLGISERIIALTIVAVGTSLPELVTSIVATKKGENDIAMGNVVGSNIFNIFFILGISSAIQPIETTFSSFYDVFFLVIVSICFFIPMYKHGRISRLVGMGMILTYCGYLGFMIYAPNF